MERKLETHGFSKVQDHITYYCVLTTVTVLIISLLNLEDVTVH